MHSPADAVAVAQATLRGAYSLDARPIVAILRYEAGGAIDPTAAFRESGWHPAKAAVCKASVKAAGNL